VTSSPIMSGLQIHPTSIRWIIRLGGNAEVLLRTTTENQTVPKFTDAL